MNIHAAGTPNKEKAQAGGSSARALTDSTHPAQGALLPVWHLLGLLMLSAWVAASDFVKAALGCGTPLYWLATASLLVPVSAVLFGFRAYLLRWVNSYPAQPGEGCFLPTIDGTINPVVRWGRTNTTTCTAVSAEWYCLTKDVLSLRPCRCHSSM